MALPSGYIQGDWIKSSGLQYIDIGVIPQNNYKVECKFSWNGSGHSLAYGALHNANTNGMWFGCTVSSNINYFWGGGYASGYYSYNVSANTEYKIEHTFGGEVRINEQLKKTYSQTTPQSQGTMGLFCYHDLKDNTYKSFSSISLEYYKVWDNNGTLIRNLVPAKRTSDNEIGMYDLVNDVFYTNQGQGEFEFSEVPVYYCNIWLKVSDNEVQRIKKVIVA